MLKKILTAVSIIALFAPFAAAQKGAFKNDISFLEEIEYAFPDSSAGAAEHSVVNISLHVETHLKGRINPMTTRKYCTAVIIDENWAVAYEHCQGHIDGVIVKREEPYYGPDFFKETEIVDYEIKRRVARDYKVYDRFFDSANEEDVQVVGAGQLVLLNIGANSVLKERFASYPKSKLYFPENADASLVNYTGFQMFLSRRSNTPINIKRAAYQRQLKNSCNEAGCLEVEGGFMQREGRLGDFLFVRGATGEEFAIAMNTGDFTGKSNTSSVQFEELQPSTYIALMQVLSEKDPEAWRRIANRIITSPQGLLIPADNNRMVTQDN